MLIKSQMVLHSKCCTHLETEADGRDDAEHRGPGAGPTHRQEETYWRVIFWSSPLQRKWEKGAIVRSPLVMPWHLETLCHRVQLSITGTWLTRVTEVSQRGGQCHNREANEEEVSRTVWSTLSVESCTQCCRERWWELELKAWCGIWWWWLWSGRSQPEYPEHCERSETKHVFVEFLKRKSTINKSGGFIFCVWSVHTNTGHLTWCISECWSLWRWTVVGWGAHRAAPAQSARPCRNGTAFLTPASQSPAHTGSHTLKHKRTDNTPTRSHPRTDTKRKHQVQTVGLNVCLTLQLTLLQLVVHYDQKRHSNHKKVEDKADLTQLTDGRPAQRLYHRLVGALATDGGGVAQDDESTDQEHQGDLSGWRTELGVTPVGPKCRTNRLTSWKKVLYPQSFSCCLCKCPDWLLTQLALIQLLNGWMLFCASDKLRVCV